MASRGTSVYRIRHPNCSREVIEAVVHALDGPQPMRNFKPSERTPNSVDHFWQTHQAGYEARGRPSKDRVAQVQRHNAVHPALIDELDRRLSIAKINAVKNANTHKNHDHASVTCHKLKRISHQLKKSTANCRSRSAVRTRPMKSKYRERVNDYRCRRAKNRLKFRNQYCQVKTPAIDKKTGKDYCYELLNQSSSVEKSNPALAPKDIDPQAIKGTESSRKVQKIYENTEKKSNSSKVGSLVYPATTDPSVTSYNSFFSIDHEPMVSD